VSGVRRRGARSRRPDEDFRFEAGDVVVLLGRPESLLLAEHRLLKRDRTRSAQVLSGLDKKA